MARGLAPVAMLTMQDLTMQEHAIQELTLTPERSMLGTACVCNQLTDDTRRGGVKGCPHRRASVRVLSVVLCCLVQGMGVELSPAINEATVGVQANISAPGAKVSHTLMYFRPKGVQHPRPWYATCMQRLTCNPLCATTDTQPLYATTHSHSTTRM